MAGDRRDLGDRRMLGLVVADDVDEGRRLVEASLDSEGDGRLRQGPVDCVGRLLGHLILGSGWVVVAWDPGIRLSTGLIHLHLGQRRLVLVSL